MKNLMIKLCLITFFILYMLLNQTNIFANNSISITNNNNTMSVSVNDTFFIAPNITITSDTNLTGANILITNLPDDVSITYTNVAGITVNHDATNDIYTMTGNASAANYQTLFRSFEMTTGSTTAGDIKISFTLNFSNSNALYNVESGHYYEYVTYSSTWTQANTNANTKTFNERQGYLTTITQQSENDFIYYKVVDTGTQNHGWLGANDTQNEGTWRWLTGPEADTIFRKVQDGIPINVMFHMWQLGEPNNAWGGEHYLMLYAHLGTWNDSTPATTLPGYIIEYGGLDSDSITGDYEETITLAINNRYNVTFDSNTGSGTMSAQAITYDSSATLTTNTFIKTGYTFSGWNTASDGSGTAYNDDASFTMSVEGITLYAQWQINTYTITFDTDGGSTVSAITQDYNTEVSTPSDPTKEGYTFDGWSADVPTTIPANDTTLTALWQINTYTITFDTDGGSTVSAISQDYNTEVSTPSDPTKEGYTFEGWSDDVPTTMPANDTTLTALWQINTYTITFDTDGGSEVENLIVEYLDRIQLNQTTSKEGHVFLGWQYNQEIIDHISMPSQDIELIALFELIAETMFTITFDSNGGNTIESIQLKFNDDIPNIATPEKTGFTFIGWYNYLDDTLFTDTKMQSKSINLYAKWRINTYTATFHFNNNEDIIILEFVYEQKIDFPASPTKIGFDFLYWSLDYQNTLENTIINMPAENISLYAIYEARVNDLYVITTQGVLYTEIISNQEINAQINISLPKGYVFIGWYTAPYGQGDIIDRNNPIQDATNIRIYPYIVFQNNSELSVNGLLNTTQSKATNPNMWIMNSTICISFLSVVYILNKRKRWKEKISLKKE